MLNDIIAASIQMKMVRRWGQSAGCAISRPKEKWAFAHSFLRVTPQCGEAKGQIRLRFQNTPFAGEFQRFPASPVESGFSLNQELFSCRL
jgi:hypothetical protein